MTTERGTWPQVGRTERVDGGIDSIVQGQWRQKEYIKDKIKRHLVSQHWNLGQILKLAPITVAVNDTKCQWYKNHSEQDSENLWYVIKLVLITVIVNCSFAAFQLPVTMAWNARACQLPSEHTVTVDFMYQLTAPWTENIIIIRDN